MTALVEKEHLKIQKKFYEEMERQLLIKVSPALILLPDDTKASVITICSQIIKKNVERNAKLWMETNYSKGIYLNLTPFYEGPRNVRRGGAWKGGCTYISSFLGENYEDPLDFS